MLIIRIMALTICPDCGQQLSDRAYTCTKCGRPSKGWLRTQRAFGIMFGIPVLAIGCYLVTYSAAYSDLAWAFIIIGTLLVLRFLILRR